MNKGFSLYLDFVRFSSAFVVLLSHWAYPRFTNGHYIWIREINLGSDAVVAFFVLSGLVIAYVAKEKEATANTFLFNRATRLYSVAAPALVLTYLLDTFGAHQWPDSSYNGPWYNNLSVFQFFWEGLTFSNEWGLLGTRLGTNGPYWSLSYEAAYYLLFAALFFIKGVGRYVAVAILLALVGPRVLLLLPAWCLGVLVWKIVSRPDFKLNLYLAWSAAAVPLAMYVVFQIARVPQWLMRIQEYLFQLNAAQINALLRFSDEFLWNNLLGILVAINFIGVAALNQHAFPIKTPENLRRFLLWGAGGSFSLYLVHYPLLQFLGTYFGSNNNKLILHFVLLALVFVICMAFAAVFERRLKGIRQWCSNFCNWLLQKFSSGHSADKAK